MDARSNEGRAFAFEGDPDADAHSNSNRESAPGAPHPLLAVDSGLCADASWRLERAIAHMDCFLARKEFQSLEESDPTRILCEALGREARSLQRNALADGAPVRESTLRSAYRLAGTLGHLAAWCAPASQESVAIHSYPVAAERDLVAYARCGGAEIVEQEAAFAAMLGVDTREARLLLTSSGMAAYALIEGYLLREVLRSSDRVLVSPGIYFETRAQLESLPALEVRTARGGARQDILEGIEQCAPRVVFVDPITNSIDLRVIDLPRLLDVAERLCKQETWFVIDGTLLSGSVNDILPARARSKVRVLYYESGCKYLQFGLDLGLAGLVVVERSVAERFEQLRRGLGAIISDTLVLPRASRATYLHYLRAQTACARAVARAVNEAAGATGAPLVGVFPSEPEHPDAAESLAYPHLGGVLALRFVDEHLNRRAPLARYIDRLMPMAQRERVPLTAGVSFGFRVPRISAAWSGFDGDDAFLRLSAGVAEEHAPTLGRLIVQCAREFERAERAGG